MKPLFRTTAVFLACVLVASTTFAQSAKHVLQVSRLALISETSVATPDWVTILGAVDPADPSAVRIHTSQLKDLWFSVSLECGLFTRTLVRSRGGEKDTSSASAQVRVRVVLDPGTAAARIAEPGAVTFCERLQVLSATLQGIIENLSCFPGGVFDPDAPGCVLTPEEIELVLRTLEANAFFFALDDVGTGVHNVVVQAQIRFATTVQEGTAEAKALIGKGAVVVEEIRLVKGLDITLE
jgi:hypothetical protein